MKKILKASLIVVILLTAFDCYAKSGNSDHGDSKQTKASANYNEHSDKAEHRSKGREDRKHEKEAREDHTESNVVHDTGVSAITIILWICGVFIAIVALLKLGFQIDFDVIELRYKLSILVGVILFLTIFISGFSINKMNLIGGEIEAIAEQHIPMTEIVAEIEMHQLEQAIWFERAYRAVETHDDRLLKEAEEKFMEFSHEVDKHLKEAIELGEVCIEKAHNDAERNEYKNVCKNLEVIEQEHADYEHHVEQVFVLFNDRKMKEAEALAEKIEEEEEELDHEIEAFLRDVEKFTKEAALEAEADEHTAVRDIKYLAVFSVLFGLLFGIYIGKGIAGITVPLFNILEVAKKIAAGDLSQKPTYEKGDEVGQLAEAVRQMVDSMILLINKANHSAQTTAATTEEFTASTTEVVKASEQVAQAVGEIASGTQDLSMLSEQTSSKTDELKATTEGMTLLLDSVSKEAAATNDLAGTGQEAAVQAGKNMGMISTSVEESARLVNALGEKSKEITKIVDLINGISEQTNLLALNAAIEAARAGDAGRGFAVVADEVRKLAVESKNATLKIEDLISQIKEDTEKAVASIGIGNRQVEEGSQVVEKALSSLREIGENVSGLVGSIDQVLDSAKAEVEIVENVQGAISSVAATAEELAANTEEVSASVEETTSSMEEISAGAAQLALNAEELTQTLSAFKTT